MKKFVTDLNSKMLVALNMPIREEYWKDTKLRFITDTYVSTILNQRKEKDLLLTYMALYNCKNSYEDVRELIYELRNESGRTKNNPIKISSIMTYASMILNYDKLTFEEDDLPKLAIEWKNDILKKEFGKNGE